MSKEAYVSFETAKLLKEKEFDWKCNRYYLERASDNEPLLCPGSIMYGEDYNKRLQRDDLSVHINVSSGKISAPTQQMACDWLEETHGLFIKIGRSMDINSNYYYSYNVLDKDNIGQIKSIRPSKEEAIEAALQYCLTNLI